MSDDTMIVQQPATLAASANGQLTAQPGRSLGRLAGALAKAQQKVRAVPHDATNSFHKYAYTSSEAIIEAAKDALAESELAVLPLEETLNGHEAKGENRYELICKFLLVHSSGESMMLLRHWPVCPDKGRPLDKATAAAATLALSYLLRDLLLMPRVAPGDDVAGREERPAEKPRAAKPISREQLAEVPGLLERAGRTWDKAASWLQMHAGSTASQMTEAHFLRLKRACEKSAAEKASKAAAPPVQTPAPQAPAPQQSSTPTDDEGYPGDEYADDVPEMDPAEVIGQPQRQELARLMKEAKRTWPQCCQFLKVPSATGLADLSRQQYQSLRTALLNRAKQNNPAPAGAAS